MTHRLYHKQIGQDVTDYLHHFVDEKSKHMIVFQMFLNRYFGKYNPTMYNDADLEDGYELRQMVMKNGVELRQKVSQKPIDLILSTANLQEVPEI